MEVTAFKIERRLAKRYSERDFDALFDKVRCLGVRLRRIELLLAFIAGHAGYDILKGLL